MELYPKLITYGIDGVQISMKYMHKIAKLAHFDQRWITIQLAFPFIQRLLARSECPKLNCKLNDDKHMGMHWKRLRWIENRTVEPEVEISVLCYNKIQYNQINIKIIYLVFRMNQTRFFCVLLDRDGVLHF